jgi:phage tail-like protein
MFFQEVNRMCRKFFILVVFAFCPVIAAAQALNNEAVIKLIKAGSPEDQIISTINTQPGSYDISANGIIALKTAGASEKVITAILQNPSAAVSPTTSGNTGQTAAPAPAPAPTAPQVSSPNRPAYENSFKFRVKWDGKYIPGVSRITGLDRTTEVVTSRAGGDPSTSQKTPGLTQFAPITLERGVSSDTAFENWVNLVWQLGAALGSESSVNDFRKDIYLELYNEAGQLVRAYKIYRCWPSEYQALPALDASGAAGAVERIKLENEGWERDTSVVAP